MLNKKQNGTAPSFDQDYWTELNTLPKFYYIGNLIADGHIGSNNNALTMDISVRDYNWLKEYKKNLTIDTKIQFRDQKPDRNSISISLTKSSAKWKKDISKFGMIPRKEERLNLPFDYCTNDKEVAALMLGFIDADGCISKNKNSMYTVSWAGRMPICCQMNDVMQEYIGVEPNAISALNKNSSDCVYSSQHSAKEDLKKIYSFLYAQNPELSDIWLERKHNKLATFMSINYGVGA